MIDAYDLRGQNLILFSQEYHTEDKPKDTIFANGGFFIVRNTPAGVGLLREWYQVPETHADTHAQYKKQNPQGLNYCWDSVMHPKHKAVTALAPPWQFGGPQVRQGTERQRTGQSNKCAGMLQRASLVCCMVVAYCEKSYFRHAERFTEVFLSVCAGLGGAAQLVQGHAFRAGDARFVFAVNAGAGRVRHMRLERIVGAVAAQRSRLEPCRRHLVSIIRRYVG